MFKSIPRIIALVVSLLFILARVPHAEALDFPSVSFPRLANLYLKSPLTDEEIDRLADWDTVVLAMSVQDTNPDAFKRLREKNPDIIILAYVTTHSFPWYWLPYIESENGPWHEIQNHIGDTWWALEDDGDHVVFWPGQYTIDPTNNARVIDGERWNTYLPRFLEERVMSTGYWDGIFFDNMWETASWVNNGNFDLNRDGKIDDSQDIDDAWKEGMTTILRESRKRLGDDAILISNGGNGYMKYLNGRMFESFPNIWEDKWNGSMPHYFHLSNDAVNPQLIIINGDTLNTGKFDDWKDMRFALTSALLKDGFFSYDWGTEDHTQFWWYDEYDVALGRPTTTAKNILNGKTTAQVGVWRRDFEKGIALVNSTAKSQRVILEGGFERIKGSQDSSVNSGELTTIVTLPPEDGILLLKRLSLVENAPFINGNFVKVTNRFGTEVRKSFFSFTGAADGGRLTSVGDLDRDGSKEVVIASGNRIIVKTTAGKALSAFYPYGKGYNGDVTFAVGDVNGDKRKEIITGTGKGHAPLVRIFTSNGKQVYKEFTAYGSTLRAGVQVAAGDVNGDGKDEIVTGAGTGTAPHVRVFSGTTGKPLTKGFFAYTSTLRVGVSVAVGDVDGDGTQDIITGPGKGGGPHVRIFDMDGKAKGGGFFPYDTANRSGVRVGAADTNNDGTSEIFISLERE